MWLRVGGEERLGSGKGREKRNDNERKKKKKEGGEKEKKGKEKREVEGIPTCGIEPILKSRYLHLPRQVKLACFERYNLLSYC